MLLLTVRYATCQKLADYQYQRLEFLNSKDSYTITALATRKFKRMRAFARFRIENWCTDLAHVNKFAKENNGVKYFLVRQDLFDRTVNARGMKTKDSQETVKAFSSLITKESTEEGLVWQEDRIWNLLKRLKSFVLLRGYKFTLLWVKLRRLLLNIQYGHWKIFCTVTWKIMDKSIHTNYRILSLP